jgi:hypothetical protein
MKTANVVFVCVGPTGDIVPTRVTQQADGGIRIEYTSMYVGRCSTQALIFIVEIYIHLHYNV